LSSGIYCRVKWLSTDVSEVRTASIIRKVINIKTYLHKICDMKFKLILRY
jgi:hypothetical protein